MSDTSSASRLEAGSSFALLEFLVSSLLIAGFFLGPLKLLGNSWVAYLGPDALAVLILVLLIGQRLAARKPLLARSPLTVPLVLLIGYCILELANPTAPFTRSVIGLRSWVLYLCFYFVGFYGLRSIRQIERLYALLLVLAVLTAVYGVYQWRTGPQTFASWSDAYGHYAQVMWTYESGTRVFRAFSTFVLPNVFAGNMALIMLLAFSVSAASSMRVYWRILGGAAFAVLGLGIAVSGSRGAVAHLLIAAAIGTAFIRAKRPRVAAIGLLVGGATVLLVALELGSVVNERFASIADPNAFFWKWFHPLRGGVGIAAANPFGMGLGYTAGVPRFLSNAALQDLPIVNIDSGYGSAAAELGFVGLGLFLYLAVQVGVSAFRSWTALPVGRARDLLLGPALVCASYPIVSLVFQPQATLPSSIYCWLLTGMLMRAPGVLSQELRTE